MDDATIRRATVSDVDAVAVLFDAYRQFYDQPSDLAAAKAFLTDRLQRNESVVFLAESAGRAVGFTQLYRSFTSTGLAPIFILNDLFVDPAARNTGVGAALLAAAADHAREAGAVRLTLSTATTNTTAQSVYEKNGWIRDTKFFVYHLALR